jgi:hypothetical protein
MREQAEATYTQNGKVYDVCREYFQPHSRMNAVTSDSTLPLAINQGIEEQQVDGSFVEKAPPTNKYHTKSFPHKMHRPYTRLPLCSTVSYTMSELPHLLPA